MKEQALDVYREPATGSRLTLLDSTRSGLEVVAGVLAGSGKQYPIQAGMPVFALAEELRGSAAFARTYYASIADTYDENVHVTFELYKDKESEVRNSMIELLHLKPDDKVLEISAGTGKDSELIVQRLGAAGELWLLDISPDMLVQAREKTSQYPARVEAAVADACRLPYPDHYFDALYCFAGVGHFLDQRAALQEMARVVRSGGRVVFCEKNVPPWLRQTHYAKVLINNNPMFADPSPLELIPVSARNVGIRWILGGVHYVVDYTVGEGEPSGNFDLTLPGFRGGTFNTRYSGRLEGVTPEAKELYERAAAKSGVSLHQWLDAAVREKALRDLG